MVKKSGSLTIPTYGTIGKWATQKQMPRRLRIHCVETGLVVPVRYLYGHGCPGYCIVGCGDRPAGEMEGEAGDAETGAENNETSDAEDEEAETAEDDFETDDDEESDGTPPGAGQGEQDEAGEAETDSVTATPPDPFAFDYIIQCPSHCRRSIFNSIFFLRCDGLHRNALGDEIVGKYKKENRVEQTDRITGGRPGREFKVSARLNLDDLFRYRLRLSEAGPR